MKKLLISLVLATVLSVCAFAVTPAVNVLTGTKDALNFENVSGEDYFNYGNPEYIQYMTYDVVNAPTSSGRGKVFSAKADLDAIAADKGSDTYIYYQLIKTLPETLDRPAHLIFETNGNGQIGFWLNAVNNKHTGTLKGSWSVVSVNDGGSILGSPEALKIQYATRKNGCINVQYFDNVALYPYYKIVYTAVYPDGSTGASTTKYYFDASNLKVAKDGTASGFPTSYTVESVTASFPGYSFLGWTTEKNGKTAMTSVSLSGKDITLYPVWEKKTVVAPVNVTVYLDEEKTKSVTDVCDAGYNFKLPSYAELAQYTKAGKMPTGFRMNGVLYAPGKSVMLPEVDSVVFTAEFTDTLHEEYGELVMLENFDSLENGTYICDAEKGQSNPVNPAYINPSWSTNKEHFLLRYGDSMNGLQIVENDGNNMLKVTKINASSMWPQMYLFNNGATPDGLYTVTADFVIPKSEISHLTNINVRVYYSGKEASNVQATITSLSGGNNGITVACTIAAAQGSNITAIPKIQIFATADATDYKTTYYVDNISIYYKKAYAEVKLSDKASKKIFFTPGDEITLPHAYEILDSIPDGYVLSGFRKGEKLYKPGDVYTTSSSEGNISFEAEYEERVYSVKFDLGTLSGTIAEIPVYDGDKITLPDSGFYHPSRTLSGWKIYGTDKVLEPASEYTFKVSSAKEYLDGTDRLVFVPALNMEDKTAYYFKEDFTLPSGTSSEKVTYALLAEVADSLYYGVRRASSPNNSDKERLSDMAQKGILPADVSLSDNVKAEEAADMLANVLPNTFYNELCFDVDEEDAENKKLVRAGIFDESLDFTKEITYIELKTAAEKLCDKSKRSVENKRKFFVLGDSLTEAYGPSNPTKGWPEFIDNYFTGNITTVNYGIAGINTGSYFNPSHARATDYYNKMITSVGKGDYVIIALGTNDSTLWGRGSMTKEESRKNYYRLISEIRVQGGIPVLVGPVGRNETDENGNYKESDPDIIPVMQSVNEIYGVNVPIIDFKQVSFDRLSAMTAAERGEFYIDTVHYRAKGADMVAGWFSELVLASDNIQLDAFKNHFAREEEAIPEIVLDLGEKMSQTNVRFVEIGGYQMPAEESENKISIPLGTENMLVEVVEKQTADSVTAVRTTYYYVDADKKTYTKFTEENLVNNKEDISIRGKDPSGIRFKASFSNSAKHENSEFVMDEYGFIITREDLLGKSELNFDFRVFVSGAAYNKKAGTDVVFDSSDDLYSVAAGVLYGIPERHYRTKIVCKTYTKISVGEGSFVVYGEPMSASLYEIAKECLKLDLPEEQRAYAERIVKYVEDKDILLDGDDLYKD